MTLNDSSSRKICRTFLENTLAKLRQLQLSSREENKINVRNVLEKTKRRSGEGMQKLFNDRPFSSNELN